MQKIPALKHLLSFLFPVRISTANSTLNPLLELFLYRNQWQLATEDALYSDGTRYQPLRVAYKEINQNLPFIENVLVLGTGLGSAVQILNKKGYNPNFTLVDKDKAVLHWALELMENIDKNKITPVLADADEFVKDNKTIHDLIIIDIFEGRVVPPFVTTPEFLNNCKNNLKKGGKLIFNYITIRPDKLENLKQTMNQIFPDNRIVNMDVNRIFIATA